MDNQPRPIGRPPISSYAQRDEPAKNLYLEQHELIAQILGKTKNIGPEVEL